MLLIAPAFGRFGRQLHCFLALFNGSFKIADFGVGAGQGVDERCVLVLPAGCREGRRRGRWRGVRPDAVVLLEDVRTRADRQRPFWAKLEAR